METRGFCRRVYVLARIFGKIEGVAALVMLRVERGCIVLVLCAVSRADKWTHSEIKVGVRSRPNDEKQAQKLGKNRGCHQLLVSFVSLLFLAFIVGISWDLLVRAKRTNVFGREFITPRGRQAKAAPESISLSKRCVANADKMNVRASRLSYLIEDSGIAVLLNHTSARSRRKTLLNN